METWVDYSGGNPGGANLRAAGVTGAIRYVGIGSGPKRLTAAELADLVVNSVQVYGVAESTVSRSLSGYSAGLADAQAVQADPTATRLPIIYATDDETTWTQASVDYVRAFRDVLGVGRTGAYGFAPFLAAVHAAGLASSYWQAGLPPSRTGTSAFVNIWQRQGTSGAASDGPASPTTVTIGGVGCDLNNRLITEATIMTGPVQLDLNQPLTEYKLSGASQPGTVAHALGLMEACYEILSNQGANNPFQNALGAIQMQLAAVAAQVTALSGALTAEEAALLAAIKAMPTGVQVDVTALSAALSASLAKDEVAALAAQLAKP
jgi:hypothetical protein